jgi:hypothetical protein
MKKILIGLACVFALLTSCKEKTPEEKIIDGAEEVQQGTVEKAKEIGDKANKLLKSVKKDVKDATEK